MEINRLLIKIHKTITFMLLLYFENTLKFYMSIKVRQIYLQHYSPRYNAHIQKDA